MSRPGRNHRAPARSLAHHGESAQMMQLAEECLELALAIRHQTRGKASMSDIASEIADVEIMIEQARMIIGSAEVDSHKREKLRLITQTLDGLGAGR